MDITPVPRIGLLSKLSDDDLRTLGECAQLVRFAAEQEILRQGQRNASLFVVQDGVLHVRRHAKGHDVLLGRLEPGSVFGEISLFDPGPTTAAVHAVSDGTLIEIRREHLDRFLARCPSGAALLLLGLLEAMASRLRRTDDRLIDSILWGGLLK
jgi:CRP/FNR family transcriptional regulator, cyclic AMP receptor protein